MSLASRVCLSRAETLRAELRDERYADALAQARHSGLEQGVLDTWLSDERELVAQVVADGPSARAKILRRLTIEQQIHLIMAAVRYCLQAAAILEGFERHIENCPADLFVIGQAHQALDWYCEEPRQSWPANADFLHCWPD